MIVYYLNTEYYILSLLYNMPPKKEVVKDVDLKNNTTKIHMPLVDKEELLYGQIKKNLAIDVSL